MENTEKMPVDIKEKWVKALRSGKYIQGEGNLYDKDSSTKVGKPVMCCLGVLEHLCGTPFDFLDDISFPGDISGNSPEMFLDNGGDYISDYLADMNDGNSEKVIKKHSFIEIADYIEINL